MQQHGYKYNRGRFSNRNHNNGIVAVPDPDQDIDTRLDCVCNRNKKTIFCTACDNFFYGRIRKLCTNHPNVSGILNHSETKQMMLILHKFLQVWFLYDINKCPNCLAGVYMLHEVDNIDYQTVVKATNESKIAQASVTSENTQV